jgi:hypothetical protein
MTMIDRYDICTSGEVYKCDSGEWLMVDYQARIAELEGIAQVLFALLDDIDTADDIAKGDNNVFRGLARSASLKRFHVATTDGYNVKFNTRLATRENEP